MRLSFYLSLLWEGIASNQTKLFLAYIPNNFTLGTLGTWVCVNYNLLTIRQEVLLDISLEAEVSNTELMITVMDMETSYVIVVYSNDGSFTTSAHAAISHPRAEISQTSSF